jgi:hypothetical protein
MLPDYRSALRTAPAALAAAAVAGLPMSAHAAPADAGPWLAYIAFIAAAIVVVVMLLRAALEPPDERPERSDARDRSPMRHRAAHRSVAKGRSTRRPA